MRSLLRLKGKNINSDLLYEVKKGDIAAVETALKNGADVNAKDKKFGITALMFAARGGHSGIVQILLDKGAKIKATAGNWYGRTALIFAAINGHKAAVKVLLDRGAAVNEKDNWEGAAPLMVAASNGHSAVIQVLLDYDADVDAETKNGMTALMWSSKAGHLDVSLVLIDNGADIDAKDNCEKNALMYAAEEGHTDIVDRLLEKGAKVNTKDKDGNKALDLAKNRRAVYPRITELLQQAGEQSDQTDDSSMRWLNKVNFAEQTEKSGNETRSPNDP